MEPAFGRFHPREARWLVMIPFAVIDWAARLDRLLQPLTLRVLLARLFFRAMPAEQV